MFFEKIFSSVILSKIKTFSLLFSLVVNVEKAKKQEQLTKHCLHNN